MRCQTSRTGYFKYLSAQNTPPLYSLILFSETLSTLSSRTFVKVIYCSSSHFSFSSALSQSLNVPLRGTLTSPCAQMPHLSGYGISVLSRFLSSPFFSLGWSLVFWVRAFSKSQMTPAYAKGPRLSKLAWETSKFIS